jgi:hypothetical protein
MPRLMIRKELARPAVEIVSAFPDSSSATPLRPAWSIHGSTRMLERTTAAGIGPKNVTVRVVCAWLRSWFEVAEIDPIERPKGGSDRAI